MRQQQEKTASQKIEEMLKTPKRKTQASAQPEQTIHVDCPDTRPDELLEIKKTVKQLMLKQRRDWTEKEKEYFQIANQSPLKEQLKSVK